MAYLGESDVTADCGCHFIITLNLDTRRLGLIPTTPPILKIDPLIEVQYCRAHSVGFEMYNRSGSVSERNADVRKRNKEVRERNFEARKRNLMNEITLERLALYHILKEI